MCVSTEEIDNFTNSFKTLILTIHSFAEKHLKFVTATNICLMFAQHIKVVSF